MLSASSNFSGSLPAVTPTKTTIQTAKTIHFARRPDGNENTEPLHCVRMIIRAARTIPPQWSPAPGRRSSRRRRRWACPRPRAGRRAAAASSSPRRAAGEDQVGTERFADDAGELAQVVADEGDLPDRGEVEIERPQEVGEAVRMVERRARRRGAGRPPPGARTRARRSAPRAAAGRAPPSCCPRGSGGRRSPCGGRSAPRGPRRSRRSRRARGRRSGRSSSRRASGPRSNQRCSKVDS